MNASIKKAKRFLFTLTLVALTILTLSPILIPLKIVKAATPIVKMNPSYATIGQEGQQIPTTQPATISIEVENVADLFLWQVVIYYDNNTLYTQTNWMWLPSNHVFSGKGFNPMGPSAGSDVYGHYIMMSVALQGGEPTFTGNGILCKINFTAVGVAGISFLNFTTPIGSKVGTYETYMWDSWLDDIPAKGVEGVVEVKGPSIEKKPSIVTISADKSLVYLGGSVDINGNVTLQDETPKPSVDVIIYNRLKTEITFEILATRKTDAEGRYNYTWTPTIFNLPSGNSSCIYEFKAAWLGDETTSGNESQIISITLVKMLIYIRTDGSVEPKEAPILTADNITYTFTGNISSPIVVERSNIIINGNAYTLQGSGNEDGFYLSDLNNVTIRNLNIKDFLHGVYINSSLKITISANNLENNAYGIRLSGSSSNCNASRNNITNNGMGVYLWESSNNTIFENKITQNNGNGIYLFNSVGNIISGSNISSNSDIGIYLHFASGNTISENNIAKNQADGILLLESSNNIVAGNNITNNIDNGVSISGSSGNAISRNKIVGNFDGVLFSNSLNNAASECDISDNGNSGVYVYISFNNTITKNNMTSNGYWGTILLESLNNTISKNNITKNPRGIELYFSFYNIIYHNNFIDNTDQVHSINSTNTWYKAYPIGGNYWSDYVGADLLRGPYQNETGSDGIGDTEYTISADNIDRYPLIKAYFPLFGDLNDDRKVDGKDVGTVSKFFASYPGHPRWNPIADVNQDKRVDAKDIGLIAKNFGKTSW